MAATQPAPGPSGAVRDLMSHNCREAVDAGRPAAPGRPHSGCTGCRGCPCHHVTAPLGIREIYEAARAAARERASQPSTGE